MKKFFENNTDIIAENTPVGNGPEIDGTLGAEFATFGGQDPRITTGYKPAVLTPGGGN